MLQPSQPSEEISPELMRYLDRDYWEKKEKEKADLKAKSLSDNSKLVSFGASKISEEASKTLSSTESTNTTGILIFKIIGRSSVWGTNIFHPN